MTTIYEERVSSRGTSALFAGLTILFLVLGIWRVTVQGFGVPAAVFLVLAATFFFYTVNYRTLVICLTPETLGLRFGVFSITIPVDNIDTVRLDDDLPAFLRYGGAGIHWMAVRGRYRMSVNFLAYPRVVVGLRTKMGLARDVSVTTRHPDAVIRCLREVSSGHVEGDR